MRRKLLAVTISGIIASVALPVNVAVASTSPVSLDQRVKRLERMLENPVLLQLSRRLGEQQREIQGLQDENDRLQRKIDQLKKTLDQRYADTDERLSKIEGLGVDTHDSANGNSLQPMSNTFGSPTATLNVDSIKGKVEPLVEPSSNLEKASNTEEISVPVAKLPAKISDSAPVQKAPEDLLESAQPPKANPTPVKVVDATRQPIKTRPATAQEKQQYKDAYALIKKSKYQQSIEAFETFQANSPNSDLASNAMYWAGEGYFVLGKHAQALESFLSVIERYPNSPKIPDATLRAGDAYENLGETKKSRDMYKRVIELRPNSRAAKNAKKRLSR